MFWLRIILRIDWCGVEYDGDKETFLGFIKNVVQ